MVVYFRHRTWLLPNYLLPPTKRHADGRTQEQGNTFAVTICGKTVEPSFSPASEGRNMQACKVRYIVENEGDCIDIKMLPKRARLSCRE